MADRYVICGLAHVRSPWFRDVARWSNAAAIPADFVKCVSVEEVRARFATGRPFSVLMVDGGLAGVDRDLIDLATQAGAAVFVIDDGRTQRDWLGLGATQVLPADVQRGELSDLLDGFATPVGGIDVLPRPAVDPHLASTWTGRIIAVTGPGGTGASTVAMALAQGLSTDPRYRELVVLADLALDGDQAMLHDARDIVPGLQELVDAHRTGVPSAEALRSLVFETDRGHYHLLLGLRRHRDWAAIRPRAFEASLASLARAYRMVIADIEPDLEGEDEVGVVEIEDRNHMARTVASRADLVLVVGAPGVKGLHSLVRLVNALVSANVAPDRIVPIINRAPRSGRARAEVARAFATLLDAERRGLPSPTFVPERKRVEEAIRDGVRLPSQLASAVTNTVVGLLARSDTPAPSPLDEDPVPVSPGSLGSFFDQDDELDDGASS